MNVHHLELFYYVAKFQGITAATRSMPYGIQQPSISAQLGRLEKDLGVVLFQRRPFKLTAEGELLFQRILPFFSQLPDLGAELRQEGSLHLKVAACSSVFRHHLPRLMLEMKRKKPGLKITLEEVHWDEIVDQLARHVIDISIGAVKGPFPSSVQIEELIKISFAILVPADFPCGTWKQVLARYQRGSHIDLPLISPPAQGVIAQRFQEGISSLELTWAAEVEVANFDLIPDYVRHGFGAGVSLVIPGCSLPEGLRQIEIKEMEALQVLAVFRETPSKITTWFVQELKDLVSALVPPAIRPVKARHPN